MDHFPTSRTLLNPKFEGYKLHPITQEHAISRYALSRKPTQATSSSKAPLSFQEMRSRISHNHLSVHSESARAIYVDEEFNVCLIGIPPAAGPGTTAQDPSFHLLYEMATPMDTSSVLPVQKEYPSSAFISASTVAVSDGNGLLYILPIPNDNDARRAESKPIGIFTLRTGGAVDAPFRIHDIHRISPIAVVLLLSSRYYPAPADAGSSTNVNTKPSTSSTTTPTNSAEFDIWAVKINILSLKLNAEPRELEVLWHRRGVDVPMFVDFVEEVNAFLVLGSSTYPDPDAPPPANAEAKKYVPTDNEMAPVPRTGENLDSAMNETANVNENGVPGSKPQSELPLPPKPHPYSWTQTSDSLTLAFPLPSSTPKNKIKVLFTVQTLTVHVDAFPLDQVHTASAPVALPRFSAKALWDSINPTSCFWTWDREAEHAYGLLTLHMEKKHEGTRWMQVFAASAVSSSLAQGKDKDESDVEVPETLDPSELYMIRESLEKYTAALRTGEDASGLGLGRGVPSLVEGEVDEEADAAVGRKVWATWVGVDGGTPPWTRESPSYSAGGVNAKAKEEWEDEPITLLSTPIPGSVSSIGDLQVILKQDVDGTVFSLVPSNSSSKAAAAPGLAWKHTSTYSALAFVLASKQDTRFTYHIPSPPPHSAGGVLAFEGGSTRDRGANVYIYRPAAKRGDKWARQSVLQVDDGSGGALLGVGCVKAKVGGGVEGGEGKGGEEVVVVCLTEGELVLMRGV